MLTIYTAIFGNYDILRDPLFVRRDIKYICFTDKKIKSKIWDIRKVDVVEETPRREARKYKILAHKYINTQTNIWIDGNKFIFKNPLPIIRQLLKKGDLFVGNHPTRNCIYQEANRCLFVNKGDPIRIKAQIERYKKDCYPENNGLVNSTVLVRKLTPKVIKFCEDWWNEIKKGCCRDQISFNYIAWKNNFNYGLFNWREFVKRGGSHNK